MQMRPGRERPSAAAVLREPPAAVRGALRGRRPLAMSQLRFWLHFAALNKVTARGSLAPTRRQVPPPLPRRWSPGSRDPGERPMAAGPTLTISGCPGLELAECSLRWAPSGQVGTAHSLRASSGSPRVPDGFQPLTQG